MLYRAGVRGSASRFGQSMNLRTSPDVGIGNRRGRPKPMIRGEEEEEQQPPGVGAPRVEDSRSGHHRHYFDAALACLSPLVTSTLGAEDARCNGNRR